MRRVVLVNTDIAALGDVPSVRFFALSVTCRDGKPVVSVTRNRV